MHGYALYRLCDTMDERCETMGMYLIDFIDMELPLCTL